MALMTTDTSQIFTAKLGGLEQLGLDPGQIPRLSAVAAANQIMIAVLQTGKVVRWDQCDTSDAATTRIDFGGRSVCPDVAKVLLEPKGFHAFIITRSGDTWYLNFQSQQAKLLPKLKGHQIEVVAWDPESTPDSTRDLIVGTERGQLLHLIVLDGKEKTIRPLYTFEVGGKSQGLSMPQPVSGLHRERVLHNGDMAERLLVIVAAGCGLYTFMGPSLEGLTPRDTAKALVYEVPRDCPHGDLQVQQSCVGDGYTKNLFWLTGVGVLSCAIKNPVEADGSPLESPPNIIPFPASPKDNIRRHGGGSLVSQLLPPEPPPAPLSMALTKYHIIFLFHDRWAVVSRIDYELVQQQDWAKATHGPPRGLAADVHGERLWMYSDRQLFELEADQEDRNTWLLLLRMECFPEALRAAHEISQKTRILVAHAESLFRSGDYVAAARKFAEDTSVPFEHVALRFLNGGHKAALLEYLRWKLAACAPDDRVTRALLTVWAVEASLALLNDLRSGLQSNQDKLELQAERARLRDLLKESKNLDVHEPIYYLLQSHGWLEELAFFAEARKDYNTVIVHHVSRRDCMQAIAKLAQFKLEGADKELLSRFAPALFGAEPRNLVSLLLRPDPSQADSTKTTSQSQSQSLLPAIYLPNASPEHRREGLRYLEESNFAKRRRGFPGDLPPVEPEEEKDMLTDQAEPRSSWASGTAFFNATIVLLVKNCVEGTSGRRSNLRSGEPSPQQGAEPSVLPGLGGLDSGAEDELMTFLMRHQDHPLMDAQFALRVCSAAGLSRAVVLLYGIMEMYEEAVDAALTRGEPDIALAKQNACQPADAQLRRKLWLRIVQHQASSGDLQVVLGLLREAPELQVRDVLPYMSDAMTIAGFQSEICECLDTYEGQIESLRQEMDDHQRALQAFKEDLKEAEERCVTIEQDQLCEICAVPAMKERFYVFACRHCFHEACLRALVLPTLSKGESERLLALESMRVEHQAAAAGSLSSNPALRPLAEVEDEVDSILADDCPLCGRLMIESITRPFIDPEEKELLNSWAVS